jgi:lipopolysaccharide biosynthesis regulator YciM
LISSAAAQLQSARNFDSAISTLTKAMQIEPSNGNVQERLLFCRGRLHFDAKKHHEALSDFNEISVNSHLQPQIQSMKKICLEEISKKHQKLSQLCQKARKMSFSKGKVTSEM